MESSVRLQPDRPVSHPTSVIETAPFSPNWTSPL
jgi:hypothetical protein